MTSHVNAGLYSSASDEWATPADLFAVLAARFSFVVDVCATAENAKAPRFWTMADNGLDQVWPPALPDPLAPLDPWGCCFMNPPYSAIGQWMGKAAAAAMAGSLVVCLVPARTDTRWWWSYAVPAEIRFLPGRLKFGDGKNSAPFPSAVIVMRPGLPAWAARPWFWDWRKAAA